MKSSKRKWIWLANFLTALGILLVTMPVIPGVFQELRYQLVKPKASREVKIAQDWRIYIPKIGAEALVVEEVDAFDKGEYLAALKKGVAHAKGSVKPGEQGTTFLFAHSTDSLLNVKSYNAVFYLLNKLENGDEVWVDYQGKRLVYRVVDKEVVAANDGRYLEYSKWGQNVGAEKLDEYNLIKRVSEEPGLDEQLGNQAKTKVKSTLILQTCWPPGTTWKRLLVKAELVSESRTNLGFEV